MPEDPDALLRTFDLDQQAIPFLLRRAHARADALFVEIMCVEGVTPRQVTLLMASYQRPGGTVSELAEDIGVDLNTASQMVRRVLAKGLLRRRRSEGDGRAWVIEITHSGTDLLREVIPRNERLIEEIMRPLPEEHRPLFVESLRLMLGLGA